MPSLVFSQSIAAGATFDPLDNWNHQYPKFPGVMKLLHRATAVGVVAQWVSGSDQLLQESPVPAGGTAGVTPSTLNVDPIVDQVEPLDRQSLRYRNTAGGAVTVDGVIDYTPVA